MKNDQREQETAVELITAAALAAVFLLYLTGIFYEGIAMLLGGLVLLASGVYQTSRHWHVSLLTWILGVIFTLGGIGLRVYLVGRIRIAWVPILLLLIAAYLVWSWWRRHRR